MKVIKNIPASVQQKIAQRKSENEHSLIKQRLVQSGSNLEEFELLQLGKKELMDIFYNKILDLRQKVNEEHKKGRLATSSLYDAIISIQNNVYFQPNDEAVVADFQRQFEDLIIDFYIFKDWQKDGILDTMLKRQNREEILNNKREKIKNELQPDSRKNFVQAGMKMLLQLEGEMAKLEEEKAAKVKPGQSKLSIRSHSIVPLNLPTQPGPSSNNTTTDSTSTTPKLVEPTPIKPSSPNETTQTRSSLPFSQRLPRQNTEPYAFSPVNKGRNNGRTRGNIRNIDDEINDNQIIKEIF